MSYWRTCPDLTKPINLLQGHPLTFEKFINCFQSEVLSVTPELPEVSLGEIRPPKFLNQSDLGERDHGVTHYIVEFMKGRRPLMIPF